MESKKNKYKQKYHALKKIKYIQKAGAAEEVPAPGPMNVLSLDVGGGGLKIAIFSVDITNLSRPILKSKIIHVSFGLELHTAELILTHLIKQISGDEEGCIGYDNSQYTIHHISICLSEYRKMFTDWKVPEGLTDKLTEHLEGYVFPGVCTHFNIANHTLYKNSDTIVHSIASRAMYGILQPREGLNCTSVNIAIGTSPTLTITDENGNILGGGDGRAPAELFKDRAHKPTNLYDTYLNSLLGAGSTTSKNEAQLRIKDVLSEYPRDIGDLRKRISGISHGLANFPPQGVMDRAEYELFRHAGAFGAFGAFFAITIWEHFIKPIFIEKEASQLFNHWWLEQAPSYICFTGGVSEWKLSGFVRVLNELLIKEQNTNPLNERGPTFYDNTKIVMGPENAGLVGAALLPFFGT